MSHGERHIDRLCRQIVTDLSVCDSGAMVEMEMVIGDTVSQIMAPIDCYKQGIFVSTAARCQNIEDGSQVNQAFQWY